MKNVIWIVKYIVFNAQFNLIFERYSGFFFFNYIYFLIHALCKHKF